MPVSYPLQLELHAGPDPREQCLDRMEPIPAQIGGDARGARIECRSRGVSGNADPCLSLSFRLSWACCSPCNRGGAARRYPCPLRRLAARTVESTAPPPAAWEGK